MIIGFLTAILLALVIFGTRLLQLQRQVVDYRQFWLEQREAQPGKANRTYIALGDSSAQGIGASRPERSYVGLIRRSVEQQTNQSVTVHNISVSGAKVADVTRVQLPELQKLEHKDALITLTIGGNDMRTFSPAKFEADTDELFSQLPKQTLVADIAYFGGGRYRQFEPHVVEANAIIRKQASKYGLTMVPLHDRTKEREYFRNHSVDFFHPSDHGYRNWYDAFWPKIEEQL